MSPPRRRSARLAGATPAKAKIASGLGALPEQDDSQDTQEREANTPPRRSPAGNATFSAPKSQPATPSVRPTPSEDEMHPSRFQHSVAPPSSGLRLGFTDIKPNSSRTRNLPLTQVSTPTKVNVPSGDFTFSIARSAAGVELSDEAKKLMEDLRGRAAQIKADLVAQRELENSDADSERRIAQPKAKANRYSAAHMAEFKKMDSIENHPSLWRAQHWTPIVTGQPQGSLKRSPSKANLDDTPQSIKLSSKLSSAKPQLNEDLKMKSAVKRKSSAAELDERQTPSKATTRVTPSKAQANAGKSTFPFAKRLKKSSREDVSTASPIKQQASTVFRSPTKGLTQSYSSLARLMSPTKSSISHLSQKGPSTASLVSQPCQPSQANLSKSAPSHSLTASEKLDGLKRRILSPRSFSKITSILKGSAEKSAIPGPPAGSAVSQTPNPSRTIDKELPPLPLTTPRRRLSKHVSFTPDTKRFTEIKRSPSIKQATTPRVAFRAGEGALKYSSMDDVLSSTLVSKDAVVYPDLNVLEAKLQESIVEDVSLPKPSTPGSFTFRTDHTIKFGAASPSGFGAHPGQSSVRQVQVPTAPRLSNMPGGFPGQPTSPSSHPDKENTAPSLTSKPLFGISHGMPNKKRHRVSSDEEDATRDEAARAAKKRKEQHVPEGHAVLAPRLLASTPNRLAKMARSDTTPSRSAGRTPARTPGSATPSKKRPVLSMSRLNALSQPKQRT